MKKFIQNSEHYWWGEKCEGWHLLKSDTLSIIQERMPENTSEVLHYHEKAQQQFFILSGTATFEIDGELHVVLAKESIHIKPKALHRIFNKGKEDLQFLLISEPPAQGDRIEIIDYRDEYKEDIKTLNYEWLEKYFRVEPNDIVSLSDPQKEIIDKGGAVFYALWKNKVVGTASLMKESEDVFELSKMAVSENAQGHFIGNALMEHCINEAKKRGIKKLTLFSNTALGAAIHLYKKYGFYEVMMEKGHYERANIKMEKFIQ